MWVRWCWYAAGRDGGDVVMVRRWLEGGVDVGVMEMVYWIWWIGGEVWRRWCRLVMEALAVEVVMMAVVRVVMVMI
ncbi:hypothetical protein Tco_1389007 [Tanacetum coccineum]